MMALCVFGRPRPSTRVYLQKGFLAHIRNCSQQVCKRPQSEVLKQRCIYINEPSAGHISVMSDKDLYEVSRDFLVSWRVSPRHPQPSCSGSAFDCQSGGDNSHRNFFTVRVLYSSRCGLLTAGARHHEDSVSGRSTSTIVW